MKKCVRVSVDESLSAVISTQPQTHRSTAVVPHRPAFYIIKSHLIFSPPFTISHTLSLTQSTLSRFSPYITLSFPFIFQSASMFFTPSLSSRHLLPTFSPFLFSCHPPLLSSFSHAPVGEYNEMAMAGLWCVCACVCLCDVKLQQIYSSSLFFNPCAHRPHCYFKIL